MTEKNEITETPSMTPLICLDVSTSKTLRIKVEDTCGLQIKRMTHGLKSALSCFVMFDI